MQVMAHMSRWLAAQELEGGDLTVARVGQFLAERPDIRRVT
jgi:hypothetical protein